MCLLCFCLGQYELQWVRERLANPGAVIAVLRWGAQVGTQVAMGVAAACVAISAGLAQYVAPIAGPAVEQATLTVTRAAPAIVHVAHDAVVFEGRLVSGVLKSTVLSDPARSISRACSQVKALRGCRITVASPLQRVAPDLEDCIRRSNATSLPIRCRL